MGEMRNEFRSLVINPEGKRSCVTPRYTWEDIVKYSGNSGLDASGSG
jgi:hypothetical protein